MSQSAKAAGLFASHFDQGPTPHVIRVPGRVNLIGEHIDYHNLPVLPVAMNRCIEIAYRAGKGNRIRAVSAGFGEREFDWKPNLEPGPAGDWENYLKAAAQAVGARWKIRGGMEAAVVSDLPPAAGLSSSSALLAGCALALLRSNGIEATFEELMEVLPEGEYFVGTRGGGMDHAAVLASKPGAALLIRFAPVSVTPVVIPPGWSFLVAHSLTTAEKSGAVRAEYNSRRTAGNRALERLGLLSYRDAIERHGCDALVMLAHRHLEGEEQRCFLHVVGEAARVERAVEALQNGAKEEFGRLLDESHKSLRDLLRISNPSLDELVECARGAGAFGARLTGAGFGGCVVIACDAADRRQIAGRIADRFYRGKAGFDPASHLIEAEPSAGALSA